MARAPLKVVATKEDDQLDPLIKELNMRVQRAEQDRNRHLSRIHDVYKYALPWRHRANASQPEDQLDEIFDSTPIDVLEDFSSDMLNTFTPRGVQWLETKPVKTFGSGDLSALAPTLKEYNDVIFEEMARSNLYQAAQESYLDLGPGTMTMCIKDIHPSQPIHCEAWPVTDTLLDRGMYGKIDGRFRKRKWRPEEIKTLWPNARPLNANSTVKTGAESEVEVIDGAWRVWDDLANETWQYVVYAGGEIIWKVRYVGQGSCPIIPARWSRDSLTAWGVGPTYRTLPDIKVLNHWTFQHLKNYDKHNDPVVSYEDDGVINTEHGVDPGEWVPRAPGSKPPEPIESKMRLDLTAFSIDQIQERIRRAHYQDEPEQQGKTPPSATQWMDEAARKARRMGTPATNLVEELLYPIYYRFAYILERRGVLPKIDLNGELIRVKPVSPLIRAQQEEKVIRHVRFTETIRDLYGPQLVPILTNPIENVRVIGEGMGVEPKTMRNEAELNQAVEQFGPLIGQAVAGGEGGGTEQNA